MSSSDDQAPEQTGVPSQPGEVPGYPGTTAPPPYGQPAYAPTSPASYPPPGYPQPGYGPPPVWPVYGPPEHPRSNLAFIFGLVAAPGALVTCGLSLLLAPFAWYLAAQVRRETAAAPGRWATDTSKATAGLWLGVIGTVLLVLAIIAVVLMIVVALTDPGAFDSGTAV